jgi:hypothetical protein
MLVISQSCQGQILDVAEIDFPVKGDRLKDLNLSSSGAGIGTKEIQYTSYTPDNEYIISFGGAKIQKTNSMIRFFTSNEGNSFQGCTLNISDPGSFGKILAFLLKNSHRFRLVFDDGKDSGERARVFISDKDGTNYLLLSGLNSESKKTGYIDVVSKDEEALLSSRLGGAFGYYKAFLDYKKNKPAGFKYVDFLRETNNELYKKSNNIK